ncbi:MAG: hypothetical protein EAX96_20015 [Candidatus Lokiarchaeota archaeon]|nr:hypothetical protein [Candidatus Lokiarchaeota archaeon]
MRNINTRDENKINESTVLTEKFSQDSFYSFLWLFSFRLTSIIGSIIIAFYLTAEYYGIYSIINSWGFFLAAICTFGLPDIITKIIAENRIKNPKKNRNFILSSNFIIFLIIGIVVIISIFTNRIFSIGIYNTPIFEILLYLILIKVIFSTIFTINQNVLRGFRQYKIIAIFLISGYAIKIPLLIISLIFFGLYGIFYTEIIINIVIFFLIALKTHSLLKGLEKESFKFEILEIKSLLKQSFPLFFVTLMTLLLNWLSLTIFSIYTSYKDVSYFQISFNVMNLILLISFSLSMALLPEITEKKENNIKDFQLISEKLLKLNSLLTTLSIIFVIFFFPLIIKLFYPTYDSLITFQSAIILSPFIFFNSYFLISNQILIVKEKTLIIFIINLLYFALFVPFLYILVISFLNMGLPLTFLIINLIFFPIYIFVLNKNGIKDLKAVIILGILNILIFIIVYYFLLLFIFQMFLTWVFFASIIFLFTLIVSVFIIKKDENCVSYIKNLLKFFGGIKSKE